MLILVIMCIGICIGNKFLSPKYKKANEIFQIMCSLSLIFSMGVMLGQDDNFFDKLFTLGWESFLFFLVPSVCSVILVFILTKRFMDDKRKKEKD